MMSEERRCRYAFCGKLLVRKEGEQPWNFKKREFCDKHCASQHKSNRGSTKRFRPQGADSPMTVV